MQDALSQIVTILTGAYTAPAVRWPLERTRIVIAIGPDDEPDIVDLPPEPPAPPKIRPVDELIVASIEGSSVRSVAAQLGLSRRVVAYSLDRLRAIGRIGYDGECWVSL